MLKCGDPTTQITCLDDSPACNLRNTSSPFAFKTSPASLSATTAYSVHIGGYPHSLLGREFLYFLDNQTVQLTRLCAYLLSFQVNTAERPPVPRRPVRRIAITHFSRTQSFRPITPSQSRRWLANSGSWREPSLFLLSLLICLFMYDLVSNTPTHRPACRQRKTRTIKPLFGGVKDKGKDDTTKRCGRDRSCPSPVR